MAGGQTVRPVKKKMKRLPEVSERAKHLREALGMSQNQFAEHTGIARPRISEWEAGKGVPSAEACVLLGNAAPYPENLWFWEQIGIKRAVIAYNADKILKERVQIALARKTPEGIEKTQAVVPLPELFVPNPDSTVCLVVDKKSAGLVFAEGDIVVLEPAAEAQDPHDPQRYWNQIVLVEFTKRHDDLGWPEGLFMGRLRYKRYQLDALSYLATVGPFNDSETIWRTGRSGEAITIGVWQHPSPPKQPTEGSERQKAEAERAEAYAEYRRIRDKCTSGSVIRPTPEFEAANQRLHEVESRILREEQDEQKEAEQEAAAQARDKLKLRDGCKIIGRVVAWFQAPNPAGAKG